MRNNEFVINDEKLSHMAAAFGIEKESVDQLYNNYKDLAANITSRYLAHIMRAMEKFLREKTKNPLFVINCEPYKIHVKGQKDCSAYYLSEKRFVIFFNASLNERAIRIRIAHELGHLFLQAMFELENGSKVVPKYNRTTEPLSSIFGVFTISDKNDFYSNITESGRNHENWDSLFSDFFGLRKGP